MPLQAVFGTIERRGRYSLHLVIPAGIRSAYGGQRLLRRAIGTSDPEEARRAVRGEQAILDQQVRAAKQRAGRERLVAALDPADRRRLDELGGIAEIEAKLTELRNLAAYITAGAASRPHEDDEVPEDPRAARLAAKMDAAMASAALDVIGAEARDLRALAGELEVETTAPPAWSLEGAFGLRDLSAAFAEAKGWRGKLRQSLDYTVRRFGEFHGDLPLARLTRAHLHDFDRAAVNLPPATIAGTGKLSMREAIGFADREGLRRISETVRSRLVNEHLKPLSAFALDKGYIAADPWAGFKLDRARRKVAAEKAEGRRAFTPLEVAATLARVDVVVDPRTMDWWLPHLAAFSGARLEELAQLRVADVVKHGAHICIRFTDEGDGMKLKNRHSFRTIPVPSPVLQRGFVAYAEARRAAGATLLWQEVHHPKKGAPVLRDVTLTGGGDGRFAAAYGHRFARQIRRPLELGRGTDFHSYRHAWTDAARRAGINSDIRRLIAGRLEGEDGIEARYGSGDLIAEKAAALAAVAPFIVAPAIGAEKGRQ